MHGALVGAEIRCALDAERALLRRIERHHADRGARIDDGRGGGADAHGVSEELRDQDVGIGGRGQRHRSVAEVDHRGRLARERAFDVGGNIRIEGILGDLALVHFVLAGGDCRGRGQSTGIGRCLESRSNVQAS